MLGHSVILFVSSRFVNNLGYYMLSLASTRWGGNIYVSYCLGGVVELPAYVVSFILAEKLVPTPLSLIPCWHSSGLKSLSRQLNDSQDCGGFPQFSWLTNKIAPDKSAPYKSAQTKAFFKQPLRNFDEKFEVAYRARLYWIWVRKTSRFERHPTWLLWSFIWCIIENGTSSCTCSLVDLPVSTVSQLGSQDYKRDNLEVVVW